MHPGYLCQFMQTSAYRESISSLAAGVNINNLRREHIENIEFPLASAREQQRIVEALDSYLSRLDSAVASLQKVQTKLKAYRASVLKAAVEGRLVPTEAELARREGRDYEPASVLLARILKERRRRWEEAELARMQKAGKTPKDDAWKKKYAEPETPDTSKLPSLPEGWCWASVEQVAEVGTGATPNRSVSEYWEAGTVPWVTSAAAALDVVSEASELVTELALAETNLTLYPPNTLILAMYGEGKTRGRCSVLGIAATTNQALAALVTLESAQGIRDWLKLFMDFNYDNVRRQSAGGVQPNLNLSIVRSISFPLPPLAAQARLVAEADRQLSVAKMLEEDVRRQLSRTSRLRQSILKWAFEGKLVDQDPSDEPAEELLARIRAEREAAPTTKTRGRKAKSS
jgi:type I restriction enzyme S subunit